jgi:hypothetical protein
VIVPHSSRWPTGLAIGTEGNTSITNDDVDCRPQITFVAIRFEAISAPPLGIFQN